jgi:hypothetical protein
VATDIVTIHDYASNSKVLLDRYQTSQSVTEVLSRLQPGGRALTVDGFHPDEHPVVLSEFGGVALATGGDDGWGYSRAPDSEQFLQTYGRLLAAVHECQGLAGFCYTQLTDTFQEKNGLLTAERVPKADIERLEQATRGKRKSFAMDVDPVP